MVDAVCLQLFHVLIEAGDGNQLGAEGVAVDIGGGVVLPAGKGAAAPIETADAGTVDEIARQVGGAAKSGGHPTVFVSEPVRTGQQVYAENADLIVTGMVSEGAELIADGNIHVYAPMRGRALAGAAGRRDARIFIQSMQAELVSVAGIYRNFEQRLPEHLYRKPVQIFLQDDRLVIAAIAA